MQRRLLVVVFALMLFALGVGSSVVLAGGGNSGKTACQDNGWLGLRSATGGSFANQGACVSYAAQGGALFAPTVSVGSATCTSNPLFSTEEIFFSAAGFTPTSSVTVNLVSSDPPAATTVSAPPAFDASGSVTGAAAAAYEPPQTTFTGFVVINDGSGISATTPEITSPCAP